MTFVLLIECTDAKCFKYVQHEKIYSVLSPSFTYVDLWWIYLHKTYIWYECFKENDMHVECDELKIKGITKIKKR
jgi:hypothetical protein